MQISRRLFRFLDAFTLFTLVMLFVFAFYFWDDVERAHRRAHNILGEMNLANPTADLFLWASVAFILYFLARAWGAMAGVIFQLTPEKSHAWRERLLCVRMASTFTLFALTIRTISTYVPDYIDKLPWP